MRTFLMLSVIGMLAAGIYGTIDLTFDLKNGTFIEYEDEDVVLATAFAVSARGIFTENPVKNVKKKKIAYAEREKLRLSEVSIKDFSLSDIEFSDFSRGEPPMIYDELLLDRPTAPDSLLNKDVRAALNDTATAIHEKAVETAKSESAGTSKEESKFSRKLYSRGRPPKPVKKEKEELALQNDTIKAR